MGQEIIVLLLFVGVIVYQVYRFFFRKAGSTSSSGACSKCLEHKPFPTKKHKKQEA